MAQAIKNKDVRKNCIDVERIVLDFYSGPEREVVSRKLEPIKVMKLNKKLLRFSSRYNANHNLELNPINQVKQNLVYKNYSISF